MWPFNKAEPEYFWDSFKVYDSCKDCRAVSHFGEFENSGIIYICPECGGTDIKKVIGRWQSFRISAIAMSRVVRHKFELKGDLNEN